MGRWGRRGRWAKNHTRAVVDGSKGAVVQGERLGTTSQVEGARAVIEGRGRDRIGCQRVSATTTFAAAFAVYDSHVGSASIVVRVRVRASWNSCNATAAVERRGG